MSRSLHRTIDCDGEWIDVSTYSQRQSKCAKCRITVPYNMPEIEEITELALLEGQRESTPRKRHPLFTNTMIILEFLVVLAIVTKCMGIY